MNWISVKDRLPDHKHYVLTFAMLEHGSYEECLNIGQYEHGRWIYCMSLDEPLEGVTHWAEIDLPVAKSIKGQ